MRGDRAVRGGEAEGVAVVLVEGDGAGDIAFCQPVERVMGVVGCAPERVDNAGEVAVAVPGHAGGAAGSVGAADAPVEGIDGVGGGLAVGVRFAQYVADGVVGEPPGSQRRRDGYRAIAAVVIGGGAPPFLVGFGQFPPQRVVREAANTGAVAAPAANELQCGSHSP